MRSAWDFKDGLADLASFATGQKARLDRAVRDRATTLRLGPIQPIVPAQNIEAARIIVKRSPLRAQRSSSSYVTPYSSGPYYGSPYYPVDPYYAFYPGYGYGYGYWSGPSFRFYAGPRRHGRG